MENSKPQARALIWSQIAYFLLIFPWLVIAATATQLSIDPPLVAALYLAWLGTYPVMWIGSLFMTHRCYVRGDRRSGTRWNLLPLAWIVPTVLVGVVAAL